MQQTELSPIRRTRSGKIIGPITTERNASTRSIFSPTPSPSPSPPSSPPSPVFSISDLFPSFPDMSALSVPSTTDSHLPKIPFPQNESDFPLWCSQIQAALASIASTISAADALTAKQAYLVEHQIYQTSIATHALQMANIKRWDRAYSFILSNLSRTQLILVRTVTAGDARALWTALQATYGAVRNVNTISSLYSTLSSIYKPESTSMKDYIGQILSMCIDLAAQRETISDARKKQFILDGLSRSHYYRNVASTLSLTDTAHEIALADLITTLISEEKKRH